MFLYNLLFIIIICIPTFSCSVDINSVTPVMKHNMASYTWEDEDWPNEPFGDYLKRCMKYQGKMQPFKKCKTAWNIFGRYCKRSYTLDNHVIGNDVLTWQNLQLLCGEKEEDRCNYIANLVDRTSTEIGRVSLRALIAQPTDDYEELQRRQACAQFLINNQDVFKRLNALLLEFKKSEDFLLSFWGNDPLKQASQRCYFNLSRIKSVESFLNNNIPLLTSSVILEHKRRILSVLMIGLTAAVLPVYGVVRLMFDLNESYITTLAERLISSGGPIFSLFSFVKNHYIQSAGFMGAGLYCGLQAQGEFEWTRDQFTLTQCLQAKMCHVARCLRTVEEIGNILHHYPEFTSLMNDDIYAVVQDSKKTTLQTQKLFELLKSKTFNTKPSMIANYGKILVAYRLMHETIYDLEPLLCVLGELDTYMSVARLYKEFEHERVRYTFADYNINSDQPSVVIKDLWSPFIDPSYVVPNSIELGTQNIPAHNLIITGPNEGGKSTFVRTVTTLLILAQSIGIVPAQQATITPFSYIATYLNITDDHGKSLFEAQVQRAKHILDHIDGMESNKYSFVIIDELFNGTNAFVGEATSYSIADYLSKKSNVISIFPTHFPQLTFLEENEHSINYSVSATVNDQGEISYPFVVEKGASHQNIVFDILRNEGFNTAIIDQAVKRLKTNVL